MVMGSTAVISAVWPRRKSWTACSDDPGARSSLNAGPQVVEGSHDIEGRKKGQGDAWECACGRTRGVWTGVRALTERTTQNGDEVE